MPTPREIRRRIRSVRNTSQITRAMEMVAASKMRRAQQHVTATRPYAERIAAMIGDVAAAASPQEQAQFPLLIQRPVNRAEIVLVTSDKGLAGAFNTNVIRRAVRLMAEEREAGHSEAQILAVGRRGRDFFSRFRGNVAAGFGPIPDQPSLLWIRPIVQRAIDDFVSGEVDAVYVVYTRFINTLRQVPEAIRVLPIEVPEGAGDVREYIFEPSAEAVLEALLPRFVEVQIYHAILESLASEHSSRMVAMRNATENARDLANQLNLSYNRARQAQITNEVAEIAAGAAALG
ncbi:MAG TPA: F0F1 ATP synthase subunit gamma [Thermomicrobiaceae bacterium]|nr:F0F1 ATP synthase subunit gamma [Thermomicrobiaceae bacterium]